MRPDPAAIAPDRYYKIETPALAVTLRKDSGIITSLRDRREGRELVAFGMRRTADYLDSARVDLGLHVLQLLDEAPHTMSAWHLDEVCQEQSLLSGAESRIVEAGPVRVVLEFTHQVRSSQIRSLVAIYRDLDRIDFHTAIDWREIGNRDVGIPNLKVAFTASLDQVEAWFETPFGAVRRRSDGQESPALRWASVGGDDYGITVLNDSRYGHDALGGRLRLTLVRGSHEPAPRADLGHHEVRYSLVPHAGDWRHARAPERGADFNVPLIARVVESEANRGGERTPWRPRLEHGSSVLISSLKVAEAGGARVVRLYESAGRAALAILRDLGPAARVWEANVVEDRGRELVVRGEAVELAFGPWQVMTLVVEG